MAGNNSSQALQAHTGRNGFGRRIPDGFDFSLQYIGS